VKGLCLRTQEDLERGHHLPDSLVETPDKIGRPCTSSPPPKDGRVVASAVAAGVDAGNTAMDKLRMH
jgi:hypothetical protein